MQIRDKLIEKLHKIKEMAGKLFKVQMLSKVFPQDPVETHIFAVYFTQ
jgi:hypothetical protein